MCTCAQQALRSERPPHLTNLRTHSRARAHRDSRPPLNRTTSGGGSLPRPHPFLVVCGAVNFNWHTYVWVLRSHRCPIAHILSHIRADRTCARLQDVRSAGAGARECAAATGQRQRTPPPRHAPLLRPPAAVRAARLSLSGQQPAAASAGRRGRRRPRASSADNTTMRHEHHRIYTMMTHTPLDRRHATPAR